MESLIRTATHYYPRKEISAMNAFYGGPPPTCAATGTRDATIQYCHQMPLSFNPDRLDMMLARKLRVPRNEAHAGELRENVIPLISTLHLRSDALIPTSTLFPCEEDLIRAVSYEREVKALRLQWVRSGRGDPGRPNYAVGYPSVDAIDAVSPRPGHMSPWGPILPHRLHSRGDFAIIRYQSNADGSKTPQLYSTHSMPGKPDSINRFPIIPTLLSLPFSVLHGTARLQGLFPKTIYQNHLIEIANELMLLWSWDPELEEFPNGIAIMAVDDTPCWPPPLYDPSRTGTTYLQTPSFIIPPPAASTSTMTLDNDQVLVSSLLPNVQYTEGKLVAVEPVALPSAKISDASISWPSEPESEILDLDAGNESDDESADEERSQPTLLSREEVSSWVAHSKEFQPEEWALLAKTPFEHGLHGGASANDVLMQHGAINLWDYARFHDLAVFSR
ncbi:hypothetical protein B0H13DRAFT_2430424 [Mycena leptocephala]|nr:hypothetical protein B0H13DRAFT_2430424 [Mycena leptocephala]